MSDAITFVEAKAIAAEEIDNAKNLNELIDRIVQGVYQKGKEDAVKHGQWLGEADGYADGELVYDTWYCSYCDYTVEEDEPPEWKYCPMCGARMDGET